MTESTPDSATLADTLADALMDHLKAEAGDILAGLWPVEIPALTADQHELVIAMLVAVHVGSLDDLRSARRLSPAEPVQ